MSRLNSNKEDKMDNETRMDIITELESVEHILGHVAAELEFNWDMNSMAVRSLRRQVIELQRHYESVEAMAGQLSH